MDGRMVFYVFFVSVATSAICSPTLYKEFVGFFISFFLFPLYDDFRAYNNGAGRDCFLLSLRA
jgi:hypothetical protein